MNNKNLIRVLFLAVCVLGIASARMVAKGEPKIRKPTSPLEKYEGTIDEFNGEVMSDLIEGDMRPVAATDSRQKSKKSGRSFGRNDWYLWPNGVIPYRFGSFYSSSNKNTILAAMQMISTKTDNCITFRPANTASDLEWLNIIKDNGCWSYVGSVFWGAQDLSLGNGCVYKGTAVHEFLHAIGMFHEHTRPDRDNYIRIDFNKVQTGLEDQFTKNTGYDTYSTTYDYYSIMHYSSTSFSTDGSQTIYPLQSGVTLINSYDKTDAQILTASDIEGIKRRYGCPLSAPTTQAPTTQAPTTQAPTTQAPTTQAPTTQAPTTQAPTTQAPTTQAPTTQAPTTQAPTTQAPTCDGAPTSADYDSLQSSIDAIQAALDAMQAKMDSMRL